jgi:hypothetical protein
MRKGVLHMGILDELLAGGQRQKEYSDFVDRYEQGEPSQGYSDQEVLKRYGEVSHAVAPDQYAQAAQEALSKLSPEERAVFVKRSPTSCHPRWPRPCSRASRPWWSSASWVGSAAPAPAQRERIDQAVY